jgi:hypothetical protein
LTGEAGLPKIRPSRKVRDEAVSPKAIAEETAGSRAAPATSTQERRPELKKIKNKE